MESSGVQNEELMPHQRVYLGSVMVSVDGKRPTRMQPGDTIHLNNNQGDTICRAGVTDADGTILFEFSTKDTMLNDITKPPEIEPIMWTESPTWHEPIQPVKISDMSTDRIRAIILNIGKEAKKLKTILERNEYRARFHLGALGDEITRRRHKQRRPVESNTTMERN